MMMTMDSLPHDIMNESAFEIANSMIQGDINLNVTQTTLSNSCENMGSPHFGSHSAIDFDSSRLDDEDIFNHVNVPVTSSDVSMVVNCTNLSTRLRRRKASQPQRLVYCDLDYNGQDDCNPDLEGSELNIDMSVDNCDSIESTLQVVADGPKETDQVNKSDAKVRGKGFKCEICGSYWKTMSRLRSHHRTHGSPQAPKSFACDICGKLFGWEYSWKSHMLAHSDDNPNKCPHCGLKLFNKTALNNHIKRIHQNPERPFKCTQCPKCFISKSELNQHSFVHNVDSDKQFMCEQCGKTFRSKSYMERHYKTHSGIKPFKCPHCGKLLADKTGFTAHVRAHVGDRPFACIVCGKRYTIKRHLTSHMIIHSDLRPFKCDHEECGKTFRSRTNFRMHKDSHLGIKRWTCKYCNRTFLSQGNMAKHVRRHVGDRKHKCDACGKAFIEKQELKNHLKMHANEIHKKGVKKAAAYQFPSDLIVAADPPESLVGISSCSATGMSTSTIIDNNTTESMVNSVMIAVMDSDVPNTSSQSLSNETISTSSSPLQMQSQLMTTSSLMATSPAIPSTHGSIINFCDNQVLGNNLQILNDYQKLLNPQSGKQLVSCYSSSYPLNESSATQVFNSCTLCSNCFATINQLRDHLVEYHRVEVDKVLSMMY